MTYEQGIRIASRTVAAYLLFWAVSDATYLPRETLSVVHAIHVYGAGFSALSAFSAFYSIRLYVLYLAENILRIALWLVAAGWFYRCDPRILKFFGPEADDNLDVDTTGPEAVEL